MKTKDPNSKSTQVLLVRHGQSQGNAEGRFGGHTATPLSQRGVIQAHATATVLATESITAIYSSDLARAMQTATPLSKLRNLKINSCDAFRERSVGVMEGLTFEEAAEQHPDQYAALLRRDFEHVLTGGEIPSMVIVDAVTRLIPGVLEKEDATKFESFSEEESLEHPQYTRPATFRGWDVPEVLRSGDHGRIARWRRAQALARTLALRPDLVDARGGLTDDDRRLLAEFGLE